MRNFLGSLARPMRFVVAELRIEVIWRVSWIVPIVFSLGCGATRENFVDPVGLCEVERRNTYSVSSLPFELGSAERQQFECFFGEVYQEGELWSLADDAGWVLFACGDGCQAVPVWSRGDLAELYAVGSWGGSAPKRIALVDWIVDWLPGIERDGRKVCVFLATSDVGLLMDGLDMQGVMDRLGFEGADPN